MNKYSERATKTVKIALKNAQRRMQEISGEDRRALLNEYREWLDQDSFNDDVWFSTDKRTK